MLTIILKIVPFCGASSFSIVTSRHNVANNHVNCTLYLALEHLPIVAIGACKHDSHAWITEEYRTGHTFFDAKSPHASPPAFYLATC